MDIKDLLDSEDLRFDTTVVEKNIDSSYNIMAKVSLPFFIFVFTLICSCMAQTLPSAATPNNFQAGINPTLNPYNPYNTYNPYNPYNPYTPYNPYNPYNPYQNQFYQPGQNPLTGRNVQPTVN